MVAHVYQRLQARVPWAGCGSTPRPAKCGGHLPYPLLILHSGNETFYYDDLAFNTMNYFEFISDRYARTVRGAPFRGAPLQPLFPCSAG
jgi:hypothetical protein